MMNKFVLLTFLSFFVLGLSHPLTSLCDPNDQFKCNDGKCIPIERHCDNIPDCSMGEDEEACHYLHNCERGLFMCQSGECEPSTSRCNGKRECSDGSDEFGCSQPSPVAVLTSSTTPRPVPEIHVSREIAPGPSNSGKQDLIMGPSRSLISLCNPHDEFQCDDGTCLPLERHCDNIPDCSMGEDEKVCQYLHVCKPGLFMCQSGECLHPGARCNDKRECSDGSDEQGCSKDSHVAVLTSSTTPRSVLEVHVSREIARGPSNYILSSCKSHDEFECPEGMCLPIERRCDNIPDCARGEDEEECNYLHKCEPGLFMCHSGECLHPGARCNGVSDCFDSSDEHGCPKSSSGALIDSATPRSTEMHGNQESNFWIVLFIVTLFIMIFGVFMFLLCNHYPQVRYRRDLVVDRVATAIKNSSSATVLMNSSLFTPKREETKPMVSVVNPVFS